MTRTTTCDQRIAMKQHRRLAVGLADSATHTERTTTVQTDDHNNENVGYS